jgi:hypothetical protein
MHGLHLLALLLTADQTLAEQSFVAGLEDSIHSNPVFRQWARSWSKRAIIKNAIKLASPVSAQNVPTGEWAEAHQQPQSPQPQSPQSQSTQTKFIQAETGDSLADALIACVTGLEPLQRFVFVMAVLEGYSTTECAALLACSPQQILSAKAEVLKHMGSKPCSQVTVPRKYEIVAGALMTNAQVA